MKMALASAKAINFVGSFTKDGWACTRDLARAAKYYAAAAVGTAPFVAKEAACLAASDITAFRTRGVGSRGGARRVDRDPQCPRCGWCRARSCNHRAADWIDSNATWGPQSAQAKRNGQLPEDPAPAHEAGGIVIDGLGQSARFIAAALPLKVFPLLFSRYVGGQYFGRHVDDAIRLSASAIRIRSDLSATLFLDNSATYGGGELMIEDQFGSLSVKLPAGHMVLYPTSSLHRVTPVTRGYAPRPLVAVDGAPRILFNL